MEADGSVSAEFLSSKGNGHFGHLMPALGFLFETSGFNVREVECIIVAIGPGSFTGLRVGLSAAKGLSHGLGVPIVGISSLKALASQVPYSDLPIAPIIDSRKGEVFTARYGWSNGRRLVRQGEDMCVEIEGLFSIFEEPVRFIGNDFALQGPVIKKMFGDRASLAPASSWGVKPSSIGFLGLKRFHSHDVDDAYSLTPTYLRPPDIRPNPYALSPEEKH
jgi:tRNA threonylcarbamoyladenosine biosynthesis protein TsaB